MAAAHDAQAVALQLSGERQALQMQLAAGANEVAVLRQMVSSVEREHRDAVERIQARADGEVQRAQARAAGDVEAARATQARAEAAGDGRAEGRADGEDQVRRRGKLHSMS